MPVIPALGRLRQENCEFEASLDYAARLSQKTKQNNNNKKKIAWYKLKQCPSGF
jgi:hypothetical protein